LNIHSNSHQCVRKILNDFLSAKNKSSEYDSKENLRNRGRCSILEDFSEQSDVVYSALSAGLPVSQTTHLLNEWRQCNRHLEPICHSVVERFIKRSEVINRTRRLTEKTGDLDEDTVWARARFEQSSQFLKQLYGVNSGEAPNMQLHDIFFTDENHKKVVIGHIAKYELRIARDHLGNPQSNKKGGILPPKKIRRKLNFLVK